MFFKKTIIAVICSCSLISISDAQTAPLNVEKVSSVVEPSKILGQNFSITAKLNVTDHTISQWAIGFYMPRTFNRLVNQKGTNINPDLKMQICDISTPNKCSDLVFVDQNKHYGSAGYTSVFAPKDENVKLELGKTYLLQLKNNNQWAPKKFTAMPQSFFLIEKNKVTPLKEIEPTAYDIGSYSDSLVKADIHDHIQANYTDSKPRVGDDLADQFHLVPKPVSLTRLSGAGLNLKTLNTISLRDEFNQDGTNQKLLQSFVKSTIKNSQDNSATITIQKTNMNNPEGYGLTITSNGINIKAESYAGVFYALQTLKQLIYQNPTTLPAVEITDYPRFKYRGILLDVSRHFFSIKEIKSFIDLMAMQKLNTLHIHFADDEGWRLDIKEFKNISAVGGLRGFAEPSKLTAALFQQANLDISNRKDFSPTGKLIRQNYPTATTLYQGSYSENEIRDLIAYANANQITVIPEIDLPGHARALVYSMPEVFKDPNDSSQYISVQGYTDNTIPVCLYNGANQQAKLFTQTMNNIVKRIGVMFKQQSTAYFNNEVSLGGDEVSSDVWTQSTSCNGQWATLSALEKSHYFFSQVQQKTKDVTLAGWQQFVQNENGQISQYAVPQQNAGHIWVWEPTGNDADQQGIKNAATLVNQGYSTVLAFADDTYFDLAYNPDKWEPGFGWSGAYLDTYAALRSAVDASKVQALITQAQQKNLVGIEGALWSENMMNYDHLVYMAVPKMAGLAEAAWSSQESTTSEDGKINWQSLSYRLGSDNSGFLGYLNQMTGIKYRGYPNGISQEIPNQ